MMRHPFAGIVIPETTNHSIELRSDAARVADRRTFFARLLAVAGGLGAVFAGRSSMAQERVVQPPPTATPAPGGRATPIPPEGAVTTQALGEEGSGGGTYTTRALGEEGGQGGPVTTYALGEEGSRPGGGWYTTQALGEEGSYSRPPYYSRPPRYTTYALGEEGSYGYPPPRPRYYRPRRSY